MKDIIILDVDKNIDSHALFAKLRKKRGPQIGIRDTQRGLAHAKVERRYNPLWENENIWIPAGDLKHVSNLPKYPTKGCKFIYGPNIHLENPKNIEYIDHFEVKFLVPSSWVKKVAEKYLKNAQIEIYPYGISIPNDKLDKERNRILIYLKQFNSSEKSKSQVGIVKNFASSLGMKLEIFEYGKYSRKDFIESLKLAKFAVWFGSTESQGLALLEAWSHNVPTLVRRANNWIDHDGEIFYAEAAPYLNAKRGIYSQTELLTWKDLQYFHAKLSTFNPQESLIGDLDLSTSAERFCKLFETVPK